MSHQPALTPFNADKWRCHGDMTSEPADAVDTMSSCLLGNASTTSSAQMATTPFDSLDSYGTTPNPTPSPCSVGSLLSMDPEAGVGEGEEEKESLESMVHDDENDSDESDDGDNNQDEDYSDLLSGPSSRQLGME